jgi:acetyltransferase-like isoleucine patch superfamily enzyme|tara:strand:+ start:131 stop:670 length:540 start_codon:yes stop_codon:yes gene_type:complete
MDDTEDISSINEQELIEYYGYGKTFGKLRLRLRFFKSWILHSLAYHSPHPGFTIRMQRARGVKIGQGCYIGPYVHIDLLYPDLVTMEDNVAIGSNSMIFAHVNPAANLELKKNHYPRKIEPVLLKSGTWINPKCIITLGTTMGKNSVLSIGSVAVTPIPDNCVAVGNPARIVKKLTDNN